MGVSTLFTQGNSPSLCLFAGTEIYALLFLVGGFKGPRSGMDPKRATRIPRYTPAMERYPPLNTF